MTCALLKLHPDFAYRVEAVGAEKQTVLVIDNFLENPEWLIEYCCQHKSFNKADAMYPGVRMTAPVEYFSALSLYVKPIILEVFNIKEENVINIFSTYSMVTTQPNQLRAEQAIPHFDSNHQNDLASIFYLCNESFGGTSLYRHSPTGFEFVDKSRVDTYMSSLRQSFKEGLVEQEYMNGTNKVYDRLASYPAIFNRFIMYRCTSLHSGDIAKDFEFTDLPDKGRLTLTTFIGTKPI